MSNTLRIGPLMGGGLVLGYRCPSRCQHCLYACGPHRSDGAPADRRELDSVLDTLAERAPGARYHIGGGEPFLDVEQLEHAVSGMAERGLTLEYVETNAAWVRDEAGARSTLRRLARRGLECVLVSVSPFHAEFVPLARPLALIRAASRELRHGAFVWIPELLDDLAGEPESERIDLEALLAARGDRYARELAPRYSLVPAGRAGRYLHRHGQQVPWREVAQRAPCPQRLTSTSHFHVDGQGWYVPGLCAGIALPLAELPGEVDLRSRPVLAALVDGGPAALVELAAEHGFTPQDTYSSACDLCTHARVFLYPRGYFELGPAGFYDERSIPELAPPEGTGRKR